MAFSKFLKKKAQPDAEFERKYDAKPVHDPGGAHDESNWLISYADMMTLLCGFFIMMFSMARLDEPQFESMKESVAKQFGGEYQSPSRELAKFVTQVLQEAGIEKETTVRSDHTGVAVAFQSTVFFDTLSSDVRPQGKSALDKLIGALSSQQQALSKQYRIVVEGHTDSRPVVSGIYPSNWELSSSRASRVVRMFLERGFAPDHLTAIGYADTRPEIVARKPSGEWDEEALGKNRRVVVRILEPKVDMIPVPPPPSNAVAEQNADAARAPATAPGDAPAPQAPPQTTVVPPPASAPVITAPSQPTSANANRAQTETAAATETPAETAPITPPPPPSL